MPSRQRHAQSRTFGRGGRTGRGKRTGRIGKKTTHFPKFASHLCTSAQTGKDNRMEFPKGLFIPFSCRFAFFLITCTGVSAKQAGQPPVVRSDRDIETTKPLRGAIRPGNVTMPACVPSCSDYPPQKTITYAYFFISSDNTSLSRTVRPTSVSGR